MTPPEEKSESLKNCPFCGNTFIQISHTREDIDSNFVDYQYFCCFDDKCGQPCCGAAGGIGSTIGEAKDNWNTRHAEKKVSVEEISKIILRWDSVIADKGLAEDMALAIADYVNGGKG